MSGLLGLGGTVADEVLGDGSILENLKKNKSGSTMGMTKNDSKSLWFFYWQDTIDDLLKNSL